MSVFRQVLYLVHTLLLIGVLWSAATESFFLLTVLAVLSWVTLIARDELLMREGYRLHLLEQLPPDYRAALEEQSEDFQAEMAIAFLGLDPEDQEDQLAFVRGDGHELATRLRAELDRSGGFGRRGGAA